MFYPAFQGEHAALTMMLQIHGLGSFDRCPVEFGWLPVLQKPSIAFSGRHPRRSGSSQNPNRTRNGARAKATAATSSFDSFDSLAKGEAWTSTCSIKLSKNICQ